MKMGQGVRQAILLLGTVIMVLLLPGGVVSEETLSDPALQSIDSEIQEIQKRLESYRGPNKSFFGQLSTIESLVALYRKREGRINVTIAHLTAELEQNKEESARLQVIVKEQGMKLGRRFRAMYMDGPVGFLELLLTADSFADLSRREIYYKSLVKADTKLLEEYRRNIKVLKDVQQRLENDLRRMQALKSEIENTRRSLEQQLSAKGNLIRAAHEDKETHLLVISEREATNRKMAGVIARTERRMEEARKRREEEARRAMATPEARLEPEEPTTPFIPPPEEAEGGFAAQKGRMCAPTVGRLVQGYGTQVNPRFGTKTFSKGIIIAAPEGAPIRAIWDGEVVYAGWFSGYGNIVIVSHGDHYYSLYAHASSIVRGVGSKVERGDTIARVGDTGSLDGPQLYFEIRKGTASLNPLGWVKIGC